ncbi:uncharacterized protein MELLADRAFT_113124 [Melampsora larici-populina 98AG31]|uniref:F-box domain-containing protein n=1 Tax=Melampsora larici-populina (strain 98AG31 / pathotype 3-4-7) TaxID=747676 RepID=F4S8U1_MELLP|nr:uncharacterized protein MELLADRAFT_113124 [Melampsora larici-populina 98AG31]EGF98963.1 hypothetical protein MELLADRAFT_113124 [Melampsora larici-populina 98AG31]
MSLVAANNTKSLSFGLLPVEIVDLIISHYVEMAPRAASDPMNCANKAFLLLNSYKHLLNLQLVSKSWASAVIPFAYKSVYLLSPIMSSNSVADMLDTLAIPMNVLVTSYWHSKKYWHFLLKHLEYVPVNFPPNFKTIVFMTWNGSSVEDPELVELCSLYGIRCVFTNKLTHTDLSGSASWFK